MSEQLKTKAAEVISNVLIKQADAGMKHSWLPGFSEPSVPVELLEEDME